MPSIDKYNMKTGDIILFDYTGGGFFGIFDSFIKYFTKSKYTHMGMILKDPSFLNVKLKGTYLWESSYNGTKDPQDGKIKFGVQITPLAELLNKYDGDIYLRRIICNEDKFCNERLKEIHDIVYEKPYDIVPRDWIEGIMGKDSEPQKTSRFWCSALIGYIYTSCGLLKQDTDWSILCPSDFSIEGQHLNLNENIKLSDKMIKI
tara:strand:+ start:2396 stop:3007 length:612 start_codon:yes stop_codon:yes gene_type:complete